MSKSFSIPIYQRKVGTTVHLVTLGLGALTQTRSANSLPKAEEQLRDDLRRLVRGARPADLGRFDLKRGIRLERARITVALQDRKVSGLCPIIIEPYRTGPDHTLYVCYHPSRQTEWFPEPQAETLADAAAAYFREAWSNLPPDEIERLFTSGKDSLKVLGWSAETRTLLEELPSRKKGLWDDLEIDPRNTERAKRGELKVLPRLAIDMTAALDRDASEGLPRSPYREQLQVLIGQKRRQSVVVLGDSGSGKTTIIRQLVADLLAIDDFATHRNLDKVTHVHRLLGRQLIAGMSRVGQWEQRCVELLEDLRGRSIVLYVPDLHLFGRIGRARDSDRALSDFFRGPVSRGEVTIVGECTAPAWRRLEEDDPGFASTFVKLHVAPAPRAETLRMMLGRARDLEVARPLDSPLEIDPRAFEVILDLTAGLFPAQALPGKALDVLTRLASSTEARAVGPKDVLELLSSETGLPWALLSPDKPVSAEDVVRDLETSVMGQGAAVREVADLVVRIRAGMTDPKRPYGVFLFTGPTGTGKTELAKALAGYLYGAAARSTSRLIRFDMSELSGGDAVARLIGDAFDPEGQLTAAAMAEPFSVILLDEIEKAHPAVLNLLLQLFDDGRLTDAAGNTASFTQTVIIMTSNLGARQRPPLGFDEAPDAIMLDVQKAVREFFPPELYNRIDAVVPFRPLTLGVAIDVTRKELSKLFARPGLIERSVFVQVDDAAVVKIAEDSLRAEDGARSLKRFIEDRIGSLLGEEISKAPNAAFQVMRVAKGERDLSVQSEPLVEAEPAAARYELEDLWSEPLAALRARLPEYLDKLDRLEKSPELEALAETLRHHLGEHNRGKRDHGELLYNIDWMRMTIDRLRDRVERFIVASRDMAMHAIEMSFHEREVYEPAHHPWKSEPRRRLSRMRFDFGHGGSFWEIYSTIAEAYVLERSLSKVTEPGQHAIFVEIAPYGRGRYFLGSMFDAYSRFRGAVDDVAWLVRGTNEIVSATENPAGARDAIVSESTSLVVMKIVGLCIKDYLELETGTHVWEPSITEPELLRVRVSSAEGGVSAREAIHAYQAALGRGDRPDRLLPLVRTIRFDPPRQDPSSPRSGAGSLLEMEDYVLGMPASARVLAIADAFAKLWLLRVSRVDEAPAESP